MKSENWSHGKRAREKADSLERRDGKLEKDGGRRKRGRRRRKRGRKNEMPKGSMWSSVPLPQFVKFLLIL